MKMLSIDCGLSGGFAFWGDGLMMGIIPTPTIENKKKALDCVEIRDIMNSNDVIVLEQQYNPHGKVQKGMWTNAENYGILKGIALSLNKEVHEVNVIKWKNFYPLLSPQRTRTMGKVVKADHVRVANKMFNLSLSNRQDGLADALLVGNYWNVLNRGRYNG